MTGKQKKIKKPNRIIYFILYHLISLFLRIKCKATFDRSGLEGLKGPALVLCPHISNMDFLLVAAALYPQRPTFVVSRHFLARPAIRWFLEGMHVISKKMFCPDIQTIKNIIKAKESGNVVVLFPEGRLTCIGHSLNVTEGTADLVKKLGVDVYTVTGNGAYKTLPKWGKSGFRPGKIHVTTSKMLDAGAIGSMTRDQIEAAIEAVIFHDEDQIFENISYKCGSPALGLDGVLYKCPSCGAEFEMIAAAYTLTCQACGSSYRLDQRYKLAGGPFRHINDWYFWQEETLDTNETLESDTIVAAVNAKGNIDWNAGSGTISMDRDNISFKGEVFGQPLEFTESTASVKALPISVGHHFDLYHKKELYNFILQPDPRQVIKWSLYMDKVTKEAGR